MDKYLEETPMLNFSHKSIQELIKNRKWQELDEFNRIKEIYNYVRNEIAFGYNIDDIACKICIYDVCNLL